MFGKENHIKQKAGHPQIARVKCFLKYRD